MKQNQNSLAAALAPVLTTVRQAEQSGAPAAARIAAAQAASQTVAKALAEVMHRTRAAVEALREAGFDTSSQEAVRKAAEEANLAVLSPEVQATLQVLRSSSMWTGLLVTAGQPFTPEQERRMREHQAMQAAFKELQQVHGAAFQELRPARAAASFGATPMSQRSKYLQIPRGTVRGQG